MTKGTDLIEALLIGFEPKVAFAVADRISNRRNRDELACVQDAPTTFQLRQPHHLRHRIPAWIEPEDPALAEVRGTAHILGVQQSQLPVGLHVRADVDRLSEIDHPGAIGPNTSTLIRPDDGSTSIFALAGSSR